MTKLYQYNDNDFRIVIFNENIFDNYSKLDKKNEKEFISNDNDINYKSLNSSISRSKRMVREYALCNNFEYFVTLTVSSEHADRFSLTSCQENLRRRFKSYKKTNPDFKYILICEKHEKGGFHFHGLFAGCNPKDIIEFKEEDFEKLPKYILDIIRKGEHIYYSKTFQSKTGFCTLTKIKDLSKVSNYITKYITKNPIRNENGTLYICSRGLKKSFNYPILDLDFDKLCSTLYGNSPRKFKRYFSNDYVKVVDFSLSELDRDKKLFLSHSLKEPMTLVDILKSRLKKKCDNGL